MSIGASSTISREAVTTLEDVERTARRVFGGAHPTATAGMRDGHETRSAPNRGRSRVRM